MKRLFGILLLTVAVGLGVYLARDELFGSAQPDSASTGIVESSDVADQNKPLEAMTEQDVNAAQIAALSEVVRSLGQPEYSDSVPERPAFVSRLEWRVLQGVASDSADPDGKLVQLVNNLKFQKMKEVWRGSREPEERRVLAEAILDSIPVRYRQQELSSEQAQALQREVLEAMIADPADRRRRIAEEARRIGTDFDIEPAS